MSFMYRRVRGYPSRAGVEQQRRTRRGSPRVYTLGKYDHTACTLAVQQYDRMILYSSIIVVTAVYTSVLL